MYSIKNYVLLAFMTIGLLSCNSKNDEVIFSNTSLEELAILESYVNNVVVDTYKNLADASLELETSIKTLKESKTQENVQSACDKWKKARKYWEQSEAFLFGAAADYGIDPHIDSWPLDKTQLDKLLAGDMDSFDTEYAINNLNGGLLGFHALEYVLFKDGTARPIGEIEDKKLIYAVGVAGDLSVQTVRLEASWAGSENITNEKQELLSEYEKEPTRNYGEEMILAGQVGSPYKTGKAAIEEILTGAIDITNEVGNTKIADPVKSKNVLDVESWYSWNSLTDFIDNIKSVENAYLGGVEGKRTEGISISAYIRKRDANLDTSIQEAIKKATSEINSIGHPFRNHLNENDTRKAIEACDNLRALLEKAKETLSK